MGRLEEFCRKRKHPMQFENCRIIVSSVLASEFCGRRVEHIKRVEELYIETDRIVDLKIDQLLITTGGESSRDSECN